jgi:hypothetical protein
LASALAGTFECADFDASYGPRGELMIQFRSNRKEANGYAARDAVADLSMTIVGIPAALLGGLALWILIGEVMSPRVSYFPSGPDEANAIYAFRNPAVTAAEVGMVRGDLWTVAAFTTATSLLFGAADSSAQQVSQAELENMRAIARRAARLSPHDSRIWLVLAGLDFLIDGKDPRGTETLKLSYYTGPNEISLMPLRLLLAVRSSAIFDEEVQSLVPLDLQRIVKQRPDLKPAIALAYKNALPKGREVIEVALKEADPGFLATIPAPQKGNEIRF